jgi:aminomuconate-semialdehyde/2-hydroxymuconate-6-semialdehyde dehydrogenase
LYYHYTIGQDALFIQSGRKFNHACELRKCFYLRSHNLHNKVKKILNYIDGKLTEPQSGSYLDNIDPSRGKVYSLIPDSDHSDIDLAAIAARNAFPAWSAMPAAKRSAILVRIADLIHENLEDLAIAESVDNGKPVSLASSMDIPRAEDNMRFFGTAILHWSSEAHIMEKSAVNYTNRKPIGVVGCISPWNLPLYLFTWKIAPALAAGNTVVAKPSEITPMTAFLFSEICIAAGLPPGVLNIVHGLGPKAGESIINHPHIKAISFTGGTSTGARIAAAAAPKFKKLSLELGGKNPNIIFADCDFEKMLRTTLRSAFTNQGQICLCGSRIIVERSISEKFIAAFVEKVKQMKVGDPLNTETKSGAVVSELHMNKILSYIGLAKEEGGKILCGGERVFPGGELDGGFFIQPTVIVGLSDQCRTNREEIFGPVVTIQIFDTEEEALRLANASEYGLAASLWTSDVTRAHKFSAEIECGIVWVNCWLLRDLRTPFGGMKSSGVGREGGWEALRFFTEAQNVCIEMS